jgi:nitroreductase
MSSATTTTVLDTLTAIEARRSVKHYDATFTMPESDKQKLMELARLSPTSFNMQNWRFVLVEETALRQEIQNAAWGQAQVTEASLLLVMCADLNAPFKQPERYMENAPEPVKQQLVPMIPATYKDRPQLQRDEAMRSVGIASQTLMLAAKAMGYDSCPMVGFDPVKVGELINLPEDHVIGMLLVIGKAAQPAHARSGRLPDADVVITNRF